ncbi:hypothetical protein KL911_004009 [Ogataea haglerorum]|uniref:uncharacterized protein n=1 Tax=Ogataea haglerorum TaxID=1937702 RepID=UPI001C89E7F0|nr:uncharacterized protein KL911_004009 [Ogataea haglerorum]KAG7746806.1 hypothetical protein KL912_003935 [Ogataea haglerorum]KAG7752211.1 hypothetical protein KL911_004009 [Ogataea haglerorum]
MKQFWVLPLLCKVVLGRANPVAFAEALALEHGSDYANTMGEIAMLYPTDREWSEEAETIAPCGSYASPNNRSEFPLDDGFVALVAKSHQAWSVNLKISYNNNPKSNDDFDTWATHNLTNQIDIGHTCFYLPDIPSNINSGDNATIQLEYMAMEDESNVTHYACADIEFVEKNVFEVTEYALNCFNATDDNYYSSDITVDTSSWLSSASSAHFATLSESTTSKAATTTTSSSSSGTTTSASSSSSSSKGMAGQVSASGPFGLLFGSLLFFLL